MFAIRDYLKDNLNRLLQKSGMSQKDLAIKLDVTQAAVTNWVKGKNSPNIEIVAQMCDVFDVTIVDLLENSSNCRIQDVLPVQQELDTINQESLSNTILTSHEVELISNFRQLNDDGKEYIDKQMSFALGQYEYKKHVEYQEILRKNA